MEAFKTYLNKFPKYTPEVFEMVEPFLSKKTVEPGEYLLRHGKVCRSVVFIEEGLLRLYYLDDGKEVTKYFCRENNITTAYNSLVTQSESELAIQAVESSRLLVLPYDALQELYKRDWFWQQVGRLVVESEFLSSERHNRSLRDLSATDRYLQLLDDDPELFQRVPLNYLATYLQITPETLSRIRKKISSN